MRFPLFHTSIISVFFPFLRPGLSPIHCFFFPSFKKLSDTSSVHADRRVLRYLIFTLLLESPGERTSRPVKEVAYYYDAQRCGAMQASVAKVVDAGEK